MRARAAIVATLLILASCDHRLVKEDDLEEIKRLSQGTNIAVVHDLNQRMKMLEDGRQKDRDAIREIARSIKEGNQSGALTGETMRKIDQRLEALGFALPAPTPTPFVRRYFWEAR